jgi:hypothetical protein
LGDTEGANQSTREWIAMTHTFEAVEVERAQWSAAFQQLFPKSKWPVNRSHRGRGASPYWLSVIIFIGHQFGTTVIFTALFTFAWSLDFFCAWLSTVHLLAADISKLVSRVELALAYGDAALCACFWIEGAWLFFKETRK